ncbi:MAG: peptide ABC transporter substrate-binding protein [Deltaproteobacteria bacterium SG8_13]|nr:MAG: peptide ABC transporter substrate-binding protein [Deltaproteobacteria bacterium SG8_13]
MPGAAFAGTPYPAFGIEGNAAIRDQGGRRIAVERPYRRIISLYGAHTENLFSLGLNAEIIGVGRNEVYPAEALDKRVFSYHDDPERFLAARPDLVLIRPMIDRGYPALVDRLEQSGVAVVSLQPVNIEEMFLYWQILGLLTGKKSRAEEMIGTFQAAAAACRSLFAEIAVKKGVFFESIHSKMKTFAPDSMAVFVLESAGGINVAADAPRVRQTNIAAYGKERILAKAGQIEVYLAQYGAMNRPSIEMIRNEPGFRVIKAIREDQIYLIDEMIVSRPTMRLIDGIFEIGRNLYPDLFHPEAVNSLQGLKPFSRQ